MFSRTLMCWNTSTHHHCRVGPLTSDLIPGAGEEKDVRSSRLRKPATFKCNLSGLHKIHNSELRPPLIPRVLRRVQMKGTELCYHGSTKHMLRLAGTHVIRCQCFSVRSNTRWVHSIVRNPTSTSLSTAASRCSRPWIQRSPGARTHEQTVCIAQPLQMLSLATLKMHYRSSALLHFISEPLWSEVIVATPYHFENIYACLIGGPRLVFDICPLDSAWSVILSFPMRIVWTRFTLPKHVPIDCSTPA